MDLNSDIDLIINFLYNIIKINCELSGGVYMRQAFRGVLKKLQFILIEPVAISKIKIEK